MGFDILTRIELICDEEEFLRLLEDYKSAKAKLQSYLMREGVKLVSNRQIETAPVAAERHNDTTVD